MDWFWHVKSDNCSLVSESSCSVILLALSPCSNKVLRAQLELNQVRAEIERRISEKEEEFVNTKKNYQKAVEAMAAQLDQAHLLNNSMEKKAKNFDKIVCEWKGKVDSLSMDLDITQKECRNASSELFRVI